MSSTGETYKPSEHDGLKQDGTPDKRMDSNAGFGGSDGPDPHVEGAKGGKAHAGQESVSNIHRAMCPRVVIDTLPSVQAHRARRPQGGRHSGQEDFKRARIWR